MKITAKLRLYMYPKTNALYKYCVIVIILLLCMHRESMLLAMIYMRPTLYRKENTGKLLSFMVAVRSFENPYASNLELFVFGNQNSISCPSRDRI